MSSATPRPAGTHVLVSSLTFALAGPLMATEFEGSHGTLSTHRTASLGEVLRLCSLLELFCLYDHVHLWHPSYGQPLPEFPPVLPPLEELKRLPPGEQFLALGKGFFGKIAQKIVRSAHGMNSALIEGSPLFKRGQAEGMLHVITRSDVEAKAIEQPERLAIAEKRLREAQQDSMTVTDLTKRIERREALRNLTLSTLFGYSYAPDEAEYSDIQGSERLRWSRRFGDELWIAYQQLSNTMHGEIQELERRGKPVEVFVPPISSLILSKANSPADIPKITFDIREKLTKVRAAFREYESTIRDPNASLKEQNRASTRLAEITDALTRRDAERDLLVITEWRDTLDILPKDGKDLDEVKLSKFLLGKPLKLIVEWLRNREVMYLLKLRKNFLNVKGRAQLVHKVFGVEVTPESLAALDSPRPVTESIESGS